MSNGGQKCNAIKRLILIGNRSDIVSSMIRAFESFVPGDPFETQTTLPPLVNHASVAEIAHHVEEAISQGAELLVGGEMITL